MLEASAAAPEEAFPSCESAAAALQTAVAPAAAPLAAFASDESAAAAPQ
eukprot:COSAG06_NODE_16781_length_980_cov_1.187075_2_plen_49_part_00